MLPIGLLLFAANTVPGFFGARVEPSTGQVRIYEASAEQPLDVDWTAVARRQFPGLNPKHPPSEMLRRLRDLKRESDYPEIPISGHVPPTLASKHFYLLAMEGAIALRLTGLEGRISFDGEDSVRVGGELAAVSAQRNIHGGFALRSATPLSIQSEAIPVAEVSADKSHVITYHPAGQSLTTVITPFLPSHQPEVARRFQIGSAAYLMIRWMTDPSSDCAFAFSLFRLSGNEMREVQWAAYNCDV